VEVRGEGDEASILGAKVYAANCAMCHGMDGKKQYRKAPDISLSRLDEATMRLMITHGSKSERGVMPGYGNVLTEEEINAVSAYVFTLRQ
jgi:mono/diheme cytochrome c family protein